MNDGVFVGFHGLFSIGGLANPENPLVYVDLDTLEHFHFISNTEAEIGHPDSLLATEDSLFVVDMSSTGNLFSDPGTGVVHQIQALPPPVDALPPAALAILAALLLLAAGLGTRVARGA